MNKIVSLKGSVINDSRGLPTVALEIVSSNGMRVSASVPQGKSVGAYEAFVEKPEIAVWNIRDIIAPAIIGMSPNDQERIDEKMCELDGTHEKSRLGGNAILAVSIAVARLAAHERNIPLWKHIRNLSGCVVSEFSFPRLFVNVIHGGLHANNNLDFQEYIVIPRAQTLGSSIDAAQKIYLETKFLLEHRHGNHALPMGDEGGFAPNFSNNEEPFQILHAAAENIGLADRMDYGLDAAASNVHIRKEKLLSLYEDFAYRQHLSYIEDPFFEEDFVSFRALQKKLGTKRILGDDLTVTNIKRMKRAHSEGAITGIVIKPNQIGTVTETIAAVRQAKEWGWHIVASHRSGETLDDFIADFAYGVGAYGLKLGVPRAPERIAKYNRLRAIEQEAKIV
ncbi:MAG: phosphopyruvate hydratase [Patescibacteria group bacterium]